MVGRNVGLALLAVLTIIILPVGANAASCESLKSLSLENASNWDWRSFNLVAALMML